MAISKFCPVFIVEFELSLCSLKQQQYLWFDREGREAQKEKYKLRLFPSQIFQKYWNYPS